MKKSLFKKIFFTLLLAGFLCLFEFTSVSAADYTSYTVVPRDSLWKIAVKYQIGLREIIEANPQIKNTSLIYPGQKINIPNIDTVKALENEVISLVNIERKKSGLPPLRTNWQLSRVARYKSQDMATKGYFSHNSSTYGSPFTMMQNFGLKFSSAGENIAYGQNTPQQVMTSWMNSPGHRGNILSSAYTEVGVGVYKSSSGVYYWTQMFMKP
ncbi:LysM peptidoglycan-binding domain-containing protein [Clostridium botulinum]|uniref:LysM peptidoglycan-binding domain-containing protein n=1 Tax=Clostridium botulinum TaxID=1491 RepID=A0AAU8Z2H9_CLOBO|nr:SafA/ExsA family spore coat assembly protein [Clostridium sporogenes]AVP64960.1 LysM peptidoglycan-binding domain-containing protein [Clostridium botulinum]MBW5456896.1 SafA/ExsA family spore coat assembly protein [Clostridium sporogenes]MCF4017789.1 SafA/ExsA family spore coat assembly protein [Clostridium sporogenes]NFG04459.1 SafA/ExsA family spore coat assembly protein [Clostridium sporogenes]